MHCMYVNIIKINYTMYILAYITCIMYKYYINDHERLREIMANLERCTQIYRDCRGIT